MCGRRQSPQRNPTAPSATARRVCRQRQARRGAGAGARARACVQHTAHRRRARARAPSRGDPRAVASESGCSGFCPTFRWNRTAQQHTWRLAECECAWVAARAAARSGSRVVGRAAAARPLKGRVRPSRASMPSVRLAASCARLPPPPEPLRHAPPAAPAPRTASWQSEGSAAAARRQALASESFDSVLWLPHMSMDSDYSAL